MAATVREQYEETWHELFGLVSTRNRLLHNLDSMARFAMDVTPAGGMVIEFDVSRAEEIIRRIDGLTGEISAAMQKLNGYAEQCGAPSVKWQNIVLRE